MVSEVAVTISVITVIALAYFIVHSIRGGDLHLIHRMYLGVASCCAVWLLGIIGIYFTAPGNTTALFVWDAVTNIGCAYMPLFSLGIAFAFATGRETLSRPVKLLFLFPTATVLLVWTNPLHHAYYEIFSIVRSQAVFGPWLYLAGVFNYLCMAAGIVLIMTFAIRNRNRLYIYQAALYSLSNLIPLVVSAGVTFGVLDLSIAGTPLSFILTVLLNGLAIYRFHLLDIKPVATQRVLERISDGYLILSEAELVVSYNHPFHEVFGAQYGITENRYLRDCAAEEDMRRKSPIYNMLTSVDACRTTGATVSYEQAVGAERGGMFTKNYYIVDVTPLILSDKLSGFVVIFKDITQVKKSMQQLQDSQTRLMEQERLASLGQMVGGLAHNLKTPIMSISGCAAAIEALVSETENSLGDPEVTPDDYREICGEMRTWCEKARESCAYMSDIITAVKGQATNVSVSGSGSFTLEELIKRSALLMRHEILGAGCSVEVQRDFEGDAVFQGEINNLVQVLDNLLSNAVYAQKQAGGGAITLAIGRDETDLRILVKDTGPGVDPAVRGRLFREMTTSKGAQGTGLGLYISNAAVRGKFGGRMFVEDNPGGGAVFGICIPLENVEIREAPAQGREEE